MNLDVLISEAQNESRSARRQIKSVLDAAKAENRDILDEAEDSYCERLYSKAEAAERRLAKLREVKALEDNEEERLQVTRPTSAKRTANRTAQFRIGYEARTYHQGNDPKGRNFVSDGKYSEVL